MNKKLTYNNRDLYIGSIAEGNQMLQDHMSAHLDFDESEYVNDEWFNKFNSQIKELKNFIELTKDKKILLDIGSQFGSFSFSFLGNSSDKKAYAFDGGMNPFLCTTQIKHINELDNFHVFNFLIGNKNQVVSCFSEQFQSLALPGNDIRMMLTIDTICELLKITPDVIKIDIEGHEYEALKGMINIITNCKPIIFIEVHPKFLINYGNSVDDILSFVDSINYNILDLDRNIVQDYKTVLYNEKSDSNRTVWIPR
jgi:FkbM family methyltransferase